uniref:Uncharacterized protein n=1 Tax=Sinocyclocheilus rhinocerous TaxID=307959 RepID=A0A673N906_9TELE
MPLTVSQGEGMMVITVTSNPKSKWPALCQILSSLCYGPVCFASEDMKEKLTDTLRVIGIMVGVMNITMGCFGFIFSFWIGGVFLVVGITCVLAVKFSRPKLVVILNVVSAALAITAAVLYSMDLAMGSSLSCYREYYYYSSNNDWLTQKKRLDIMMIALSVLQLCVTISFCVLTGEALCKKDEDDPELHKPLLEDDTPGPAC